MPLDPRFHVSVSVFGYRFVVVEMMVEHHCEQLESVCAYGVEGQQGMVDGSERGVCDEHHRQIVVADIVDGEVIAFQRPSGHRRLQSVHGRIRA